MDKRRDIIKQYVIKHESATIEELRSLFPDKSTMTIRRDLDYLQGEGVLIRTHGGARVNPAVTRSEAFYGIREIENAREKDIIASKAVHLLLGLKSLYLDAGTTVMALMRRIETLQDISVITHGVNIALEAASKSRITQVTVLGGAVSPKSLAASGNTTVTQLSGMNIDTAVMSSSGFTPESGFTNGNMSECELKRAVISKSHRVIMLMDSSKIGNSLLYTFARPEDIDILVTDRALSPELQAIFEQAGVTVL